MTTCIWKQILVDTWQEPNLSFLLLIFNRTECDIALMTWVWLFIIDSALVISEIQMIDFTLRTSFSKITSLLISFAMSYLEEYHVLVSMEIIFEEYHSKHDVFVSTLFVCLRICFIRNSVPQWQEAVR